LVQLNDVRLRAQLAQQGLGGLAVRAVGLGEDGCDVPLISTLPLPTILCIRVLPHTNSNVIDDILSLRFGGHDGIRAGSSCAGEEAPEEIRGGRVGCLLLCEEQGRSRV
jgi:hypothetical protein